MIAALALAVATLAAPPAPPAARAADRDLRKEVTVAGPVDDVWTAWTTSEGAQTFFAPKANIQLEPGGPYEILFNPAGAKGERGAEDLHVLAWLPQRMLAFEWNAPPKFPAIRDGRRTFVVVELSPEGERRTRVTLHHLGWGEGGDWPAVYAYFDQAWDYVLGNLVKRFETGPIDWAARQQGRR